MDKFVERVINEYREKFPLISIGVVISLLVALTFSTLLYPFLDAYTIGAIALGLMISGIYITIREQEELLEGIRKGVWLFLSLVLFAIPAILLSYISPLLTITYYYLFLTAPVVMAELGIIPGIRKVFSLLKKRTLTYIGLNTSFIIISQLLSLILLLGSGGNILFANPVTAFVVIILMLFFVIPVYVISGVHATQMDRGR